MAKVSTATRRLSHAGRAACSVALAVTLAACSGGKGGTSGSAGANGVEKPTLTVVYGTAGSSMIPLWLAADEGLFAKHGLTVKLALGNSSVGANAVVSGHADLFMGEVTSAFQGAAQGTPMQLIATLLTKSINKFYVGKNIRVPADLKGESLAISAVGDTTDLATRLALEKLGVSPSAVTLSATGGSANRLAAMTAGGVAGTVLSEPTATKAQQQGFKLLLDQTSQPLADDGVTISTGFGAKNPKTVVAFLESLVDGIKYLRDPANRQRSLDVMAKYTSAKPTDPAVVQGYDTYQKILVSDPFPDSQAGNANLEGLKTEDPQRFSHLTLDKVVNTTFAQKLRDSGYVAGPSGSPAASPSSNG